MTNSLGKSVAVITLFLICASTACAVPEKVECEALTSGYNFVNISVDEMVFVERNPNIEAIFKRVKECYDRHPLEDRRYVLELEAARRFPGGDLLILAGLRGITDLRLAFRINSEGQITGAYNVPSG